MLNRLTLLTVIALIAAPAAAQAPIELEFEIVQDDQTIIRPRLLLREGETGTIEIDDEFELTLSAKRLDEGVEVVLELQDGEGTVRPRLVIYDEPATLTWGTKAGRTVQFKMGLAEP